MGSIFLGCLIFLLPEREREGVPFTEGVHVPLNLTIHFLIATILKDFKTCIKLFKNEKVRGKNSTDCGRRQNDVGVTVGDG